MKKTLIPLIFLLAGCSTTSVGHKNPEFSGYRMQSTAVSVTDSSEFGVSLENKIVAALNKRGVKAFATRDMARFAKSHDDLLAQIWAKGARDVLVIVYGDASQSDVVGYNMNGTATSYGNTTYGNATAVPMRSYTRQMSTRAFLVTRDNNKIWEASTDKHAAGLLFTGDGSMTSGSVDALLDAMEKDGLL